MTNPSIGSGAGTVTIHMDGKTVSVPLVPGETLLQSARGLEPPFSCEAGNCGTCMAKLEEGHATMRVNDALEEDEVAEGYILTCQGVPEHRIRSRCATSSSPKRGDGDGQGHHPR